MSIEIWTDLKCFNRKGEPTEGLSIKYSISSLGRVWNKIDNVFVSPVKTGKPDYWYVNLRPINDDKKVLRRVHNLMLCSFVGKPPSEKHTVDHIDRNRFNNSLDNLRWADKFTQNHNRDVTVMCPEGKIPLVTWLENQGYNKDTPKGLYIYNKMVTYKETFTEAIFSYSEFLSPVYKIPERQRPHSIEYEGVWYPDKESLLKHKGNCKKGTLKQRLKKGLSIEEALNLDNKDQYRFWYQDFFMSQTEHCDRLKISYIRIKALMHKNKIPFEEACEVPVKRIIKHAINGQIKRNHEWAEFFEINPRNFNTQLSRCKGDFRKALEHFKINTVLMKISPCDGDVIMNIKY